MLDEECVEREVAKGNQGMPRDLFVFDPLMENFENYVVESNFSIKLALLILIPLLFIIITGTILWKKRR